MFALLDCVSSLKPGSVQWLKGANKEERCGIMPSSAKASQVWGVQMYRNMDDMAAKRDVSVRGSCTATVCFK